VGLELQREQTQHTESSSEHSYDAASQQTAFYSMQSNYSSRSTSNHSACLTAAAGQPAFSAAASGGVIGASGLDGEHGDKTKQLYINASFAEQPNKPRSSTSSSNSSRYGSSPYSSSRRGSSSTFSSGGKRGSVTGHSKPSGLKSVQEKDGSCMSGSRGFPHLVLILLMVFTAVGVGVGVWAGVTDILGKQQRAAEAAAAAAAVALDMQEAAVGGALTFRTVMDVPSSMPANSSCAQWFGGTEVSHTPQALRQQEPLGQHTRTQFNIVSSSTYLLTCSCSFALHTAPATAAAQTLRN
jgi:hypothetical protein